LKQWLANEFIFVSESVADVAIDVVNQNTRGGYYFTLEQERTAMFATDTDRKVISTYQLNKVTFKPTIENNKNKRKILQPW
jgi:hypothetical protein